MLTIFRKGKRIEINYSPKTCAVCSSVFVPNNSTAVSCPSPVCRRERKRRNKRAYYKRNAKKIYQQQLKYLPARLSRQRAMRLFQRLGIPPICQKCAGDYRCQVHHIDFDVFNNERENLIMLCLWCHTKAHSKKPKA